MSYKSDFTQKEDRYVPKELVEVRKQEKLKAIKKVFPDAEELNNSSVVSVKLAGKKIEFYPAIDCYYSPGMGYGYGISGLLGKMEKWLESHSSQRPKDAVSN